MDKVSEQISKANASSQGRTDANLANDSNHLGGIAAEDYATKKYVQDYHDGKESDLKGYIDRQDQSVLEEAKEYTNSQIRNQDFSGFAKVTDVQALDKKLSGELEEGLTAQKNYTDQKTNQIVADVNANFDDVNGAISKLNGNMDNLFQSVSSGKSQIAGAITDKGVTTSASDSFSTMATNIRAISTSSGEIDPNFVNTSDGNATENDIRLGKIAYAKGQKIYGSLVAGDTDTDDATATAEDIKLGKTAYAKGQKVYGTLLVKETDEGYPIYGTDTSNATALSSDILYGKTAYARGQLLTGTLVNNDVEEIYGVNTDNIESERFASATIDEETGETIKTGVLAFEKSMTYCIRYITVGESDTKYIEILKVTDNGFTLTPSSDGDGSTIYKKYRYTMEELGIGANEIITSMAFGACYAGNYCYLYFLTKETVTNEQENEETICRVHVKEFHGVENGIINDEYKYPIGSQNPINTPINASKEIYRLNATRFQNSEIVTLNNSPGNFFVIQGLTTGSYREYRYIYKGEINNGNIYIYSNPYKVEQGTHQNYLPANAYKVSQNDKYIYPYKERLYTYDIFSLSVAGIITGNAGYTSGSATYDIETDTFIGNGNSSHQAYQFKVDETSGRTILKTFYLKYLDQSINGYAFLPLNDKLLVFGQIEKNGRVNIYIYDKSINDIQDSEEINTDKMILGGSTNYDDPEWYDTLTFISNDYSKIYSTAFCNNAYYFNEIFFRQILLDKDTKDLIGVKYKNKVFYATKNQLTATKEDVRKDKTFIGQNGIPETGTMEV